MEEQPKNAEDKRGAEERAGEGHYDRIDLIEVGMVLARHKWIVLGIPFVSVIICIIYVLLLPNVYKSTTKLLPPQQNQSNTVAMLGALAGAGGALIGTKGPNDLYIGMLKSRTVVDGVVSRFGLQRVYKAATLEEVRKYVSGRATFLSGKDGIITIDYEDTDPTRAADIANAYVDELYKVTQTLAVTEASQRRLFFEKQVHLAREGLVAAELAMKQTQQSTGVFKLDEQGRAVIDAIARLRAEVVAKEVQAASVRTFATKDNPEYVLIQQQLGSLRVQLGKLEKGQDKSSADTFVAARGMPDAALEYARRLRDVKYYESISELMLKQYELAKVDEARDASLIQVLDKAIPSERRFKPNRTLLVLLAGIISAAFAMLIAYLLEVARRVRENPVDLNRLRRLRMELVRR